MTLNEYIKSRGLIPAHVAQKLGISRQMINEYGKGKLPTLRTTERIAKAMTDMGAETSIADISGALLDITGTQTADSSGTRLNIEVKP